MNQQNLSKEESMTKTAFVRSCFEEVLSDGKPHRYSEIVDYTSTKAIGTEFCGGINKTAVVLYIKPLIDKADSKYLRMRHGYYQQRTPEMMLAVEIENQGSNLSSLLDKAVDLQKQLIKVHTKCCKAFPAGSNNFSSAYTIAKDGIEKCIDGLSFWIADFEDLSDTVY